MSTPKTKLECEHCHKITKHIKCCEPTCLEWSCTKCFSYVKCTVSDCTYVVCEVCSGFMEATESDVEDGNYEPLCTECREAFEKNKN